MEMVDSQKQVTWCEAVLKVRAGKASKRNCKHAALEWSSDALLGALREGQKGIGDEAVSLEDVAMEVITPLVIMQNEGCVSRKRRDRPHILKAKSALLAYSIHVGCISCRW